MGWEELKRIRENRDKPKEKKVYRLKPMSDKKKKELEEGKETTANEKSLKPSVSGNAELTRWFTDRRAEMTGICLHCGGKSCKTSDQYFKFSIAHILPKNIFKSVKTHPLNWIELCFWSPSCHTNYDNKTLDIIDLNCFDTVIKRFVAMYPDISAKERKYIPDVLLQYLEVEK